MLLCSSTGRSRASFPGVTSSRNALVSTVSYPSQTAEYVPDARAVTVVPEREASSDLICPSTDLISVWISSCEA